jgi:formate dehydrogenase subunit delta
MALADLVRMVNQISDNFVYESPDQAAIDVASHLRSFWTPQMRAEIIAYEQANGGDLSEVTRLALRHLATVD